MQIGDFRHVELPDIFGNIEKFTMCRSSYDLIFPLKEERGISVKLSQGLRFLRLESTVLDSDFDWTKLENLTELYLKAVSGINIENFLQFLRQRPNLKVFHHDNVTFGDSTQIICKAMGEYCGEIREYFSKMFFGYELRASPIVDWCDFISGFKNVRKVGLTTLEWCGGDLIGPLKQLAEHDTIETLHIKYNKMHERYQIHNRVRCIFQERLNLDGIEMKHFSRIKTIIIDGAF